MDAKVDRGRMLQAVVTGCAGFVGSHLTEALLAAGWRVRGVDCFLESYDTRLRRRFVADLADEAGFEFHAEDLADISMAELLDGVDVVFHLAARPGVRTSWEEFPSYVGPNISATQRLLEAMVATSASLVFASSSSVYGEAQSFPTSEDAPLRPISPYGVTKMAGERLVEAYRTQRGVDARIARYFTVYGPRQRSDMAFHRWIVAAMTGGEVPVFGDGSAERDFSYVADTVAATLAAVDLPSGSVVNVAGGTVASIARVLDIIGALLGKPVAVKRLPKPPGDPARTGGDTTRLREVSGWRPRWSLEDGIAAEIEWLKANLEDLRETAP